MLIEHRLQSVNVQSDMRSFLFILFAPVLSAGAALPTGGALYEGTSPCPHFSEVACNGSIAIREDTYSDGNHFLCPKDLCKDDAHGCTVNLVLFGDANAMMCTYSHEVPEMQISQKKQCKSSVGEIVTPTRSMHVHVDADLLLLHALHTHVHVPVCRAADSKYVDGWRSLFFHHHGLISLYDTCMVFEIRFGRPIYISDPGDEAARCSLAENEAQIHFVRSSSANYQCFHEYARAASASQLHLERIGLVHCGNSLGSAEPFYRGGGRDCGNCRYLSLVRTDAASLPHQAIASDHKYSPLYSAFFVVVLVWLTYWWISRYDRCKRESVGGKAKLHVPRDRKLLRETTGRRNLHGTHFRSRLLFCFLSFLSVSATISSENRTHSVGSAWVSSMDWVESILPSWLRKYINPSLQSGSNISFAVEQSQSQVSARRFDDHLPNPSKRTYNHESRGLSSDDKPKECDLDEFKVGEKKCIKLREFGERCKSDTYCFSGHCVDKRCACPEASDCWGCSSSSAPCFRVEQPLPLQLLEVCRLAATIREKPKKRFKLFSVGGKTISAMDEFASLPKLISGKSLPSYPSKSKSSFDKQCTEFWPFVSVSASNTGIAAMPPAFAQANILTGSRDDVLELMVSGPFRALKDSFVFLNGDWVATISENHQYLDSSDIADSDSSDDGFTAIVPVWPRVIDNDTNSTTESCGKTIVIEVEDQRDFDFDVHIGCGVEFVGMTENATLNIVGDIQVDGRLSFKKLTVSFSDGAINATGPIIFQHSTIVELSRCPTLFQEIGGLCLYATDMIDQADDALETCGYFDRGFLPDYNEIGNATEVARLLLRPKETAWIHPSDGSACSSLDEYGSQQVYPNLISDDSSCEKYARVICAASIKEPIVGRQYTSYFSTQYLSNHRELFSRLIDSNRIPIQVGGSLRVFQDDLFERDDDGEIVTVEYSVTDAVPSVVSIDVNLVNGEQGDIHVALDSFEDPSLSPPHEWEFHADNSVLPSKVQIHATGQVCISSVDLLLRNETGSDHLAIRIPATLFEGCLDFNVCSEDDTRLCGRSLVYFDTTQSCAVLRTDNPIYPRDLSLNIFEGRCRRLTSWNHPSLGEAFKIEVERDGETVEDIALEELSSSGNKYTFEPYASTVGLTLDENNRLPIDFSLSGGSGARIKAVTITRYNSVVSQVYFPSLWDCINVCDTVADSQGLRLGRNETEAAVINLIDAIDCRKLVLVSTGGGKAIGREACTSPDMTVTSIAELKVFLSSILSPDQPYRTLSAVIAAGLSDTEIIDLPTNRGLNLQVAADVSDDAAISAASFHISELAECSVDGIILNGTTTFDVDPLGVLDISGCTISLTEGSSPFLVNSGEATLTSVDIMDHAHLQNALSGSLELTYVEFHDSSGIINSDDGIIELSRLVLYEGYVEPSQENFGGTILLPDATRLYDTLDDETDPLCLGNDGPDLTLQASSTECQARCEEAFVCTGILVYFDEDNEAQCDLCLREEDCAFNCSAINSVYYKPKSNFYYTRVAACPTLSRTIELLEGASLEECKLYCEWYKTCEGFRLDVDELDKSTACNLFADLDLDDTCSLSDEEIIYVPYLPDKVEGYLNVDGLLTDTSRKLATYNDKNISECIALCDKTLYCSSFYATDEKEDNCILYEGNEFQRTLVPTGLHISVDGIFPYKRFMEYELCPLGSAYTEYNTKTLQRCRTRCSNDLECTSFTFWPFESHEKTNCQLHNRIAVIDELFDDDRQCDEAVLVHIAYATESFVSTARDMKFTEVVKEQDLLSDECRTLCLFDIDCVALMYSTFDTSTNTSLCSIGILSDGTKDDPDDEIFVLEATSSDLGSSYESTPACFEGEALDVSIPIAIDIAYGYVRWTRTCTTSSPLANSNISGKLSPAACGLLCDVEADCKGFIYYTDYTGQNNREKIGRCELIGGHISVGECDAVEENSDLYFRADVGSLCEAICNAHQLCSSFIPRILLGGTECELYSDIALLDICPDGQTKTSVNIGLSYRERDALVLADSQCFIPFEDTAELGCYGPDFLSSSFLPASTFSGPLTPHHCQQYCKGEGEEYYAVSDGSGCYCSSSTSFYSELSFSSPNNCTSPCDGDDSQSCGGPDFALVGATNFPRKNLTLSQCKRACFEDQKCGAILYRELEKECELRASALIETCTRDPPGQAYIESVEHYYDEPRYSYIGDTTIHTTSTLLKSDCQKLCDAFLRCQAIYFDDTTDIRNCNLLGGDVVRLEANETADGVQVARDVALFTEGFLPDSDEITRIMNIFDLDECKALCEAHYLCGAVVFGHRTCILYPRTGFADTSNAAPTATPHFVDFKAFVDIEQDFAPATGLCIDDASGIPSPLSSRLTTQSRHDCAARCNADFDCRLFTYNEVTFSDCKLYGDGVTLKNACSGVTESTFVMYTRGRFTEKEDGCLYQEMNQTSIVLYRKSIVECAALCDAWFNCRSFRIDQDTGECRLYEIEQFSEDFCADSHPSGKLYIYYSDFYFVRLTDNFCVPSNSIIGDILDGTPLEACKTLCEKSVLCVSFEHNQEGACALYSSSDFSIPCTQNNDRTLYIGYKDVVELGRNKYEYKPMQGCFDLTSSTEWATGVITEEECQDLCTNNCLGYQYLPYECHIVEGELPSLGGCRPNERFAFRVERFPYQKMEKTCLRNEITFANRIYDTEEYECLALCDAHPYCRYFLYGTTATAVDPYDILLRECKLFEAQAQQLDDCDCENDLLVQGDYCGLTAFVNGRTFIDQVTWFGEPESTYATLSGMSYQECAALCDALDNQYCSAFLHTWNYRRSSSAVRPQLFRRSRLIRADFGPGDEEALFLQIAANDAGNFNLLELSTAEQGNDDALKNQQLSNEQTVGGNDSFLLKFWSKAGKCVSAGPFSELPDGITLDIIQQNFDFNIPSCQTLYAGPCNNNDVIEFIEVAVDSSRNPGRFALAYDLPNIDSATDSVGCLTTHPGDGESYWQEIGDLFGTMVIPPDPPNCTSAVTNSTCTKITVVRTHENGSVLENSTTWAPGDCDLDLLEAVECSPGSSRQIELFHTTIENSTICRSPPIEDCTSVTDVVDFDVTSETSTCIYYSASNETTCWYTQRNAIDLLMDIDLHYEKAPECQAAPLPVSVSHSSTTRVDGSNPTDTSQRKTRALLSRSYGPACGYDEQVATIPGQLFAYSSNPVLLSNEATGDCLASDLSLVPCTDSRAEEWIHIFDESREANVGGEIFFVDHTHSMRCLSRTSNYPNASLEVSPCDSSGASLSQKWMYDGTSGLLILPDSEPQSCVLIGDSHVDVQLGSCSDSRARWSQYSECKLNTREKTKPMKVESIESPGQCLNDMATALISCSLANEWVYIFDAKYARLQQAPSWTSDPPLCLAREHDDPATFCNGDLSSRPTGLIHCAPPEDGDISNVTYWRTVLGGEEGNVFQWSLIDGQGLPDGPMYCIRTPNQEPQDICDADLDNEQHWRRYDQVVDATEISVKPDLLLQKITDPEVLFQFFLFSAEGRLSRQLRAKFKGLERDVNRLAPIIEATTLVVTDSLAMVSSVGDQVATLSDSTTATKEKFTEFGKVLRAFEPFPYVGPVIKRTKLRKTCKQVAKRLNDGTDALDKTNKVLSRVLEPFESFLSAVQKANDALVTSIMFLSGFVEFVTRTSFCAFQDGLIDHYLRMQDWIRNLLDKVGGAVGLLSDIKGYFSVLNVFKSLMASGVFKSLKKFLSVLRGVTKFADALGFITTLVDFKLCYAEPYGCSKKIRIKVGFVKFSIRIPWLCWKNKRCTDLEGLGAFMGIIERIIKSIPLVGFMWGAVEKFVKMSMEALFKFVGSFLPSFDIPLDFVDDIKDLVVEAKDEIYAIIDYFRGMMGVDGFQEWIVDATSAFRAKFPDELVNFECDNFTCFSNLLGVEIPDINTTLPSLSIGGIDYGIPDDYIDVVDTVLNDIEAFREDYETLLEGGMECSSYETVRINLMEHIRSVVGAEEGEILGIPDCPLSFRVCVAATFPAWEIFHSRSIDRIERLDLEGIFNRRKLQRGLGESDSGGIAIPLYPLKDKLLNPPAAWLKNKRIYAWNEMVQLSPETRKSLFEDSTKMPRQRFIEEMTEEWLTKHCGGYCDSPSSSWTEFDTDKRFHPLHIDDYLTLFVKMLDYAPKLVMGSDGGKFQCKLKIGTFFNAGVTFRPIKWRPTSQAKRTMDSIVYEDFHQQAKLVEVINEFNCRLDFIQATRNVREGRINVAVEDLGCANLHDKMGDYLPDSENRRKKIESKMEVAYEMLHERSSLGQDTFNYFLMRDFEKSEKKTLEKLEELSTLQEFDAKIRAEMQFYYFEKNIDCGGLFFTRQYRGDFLFFTSMELEPGARSKCIGPKKKNDTESFGFMEEMEKRPKISSSVLLAKGANKFFDDSKFWESIKDIEFHPTKFGNLFGAGWDILIIVRQALLGNGKLDETELKASMVGPSWASCGDWTPPFLEAFADLGSFLWSSIEMASKWYHQSKTDDEKFVKKTLDLAEAIYISPEEAKHLAYAQRFALKTELSFFEVNFNIKGDPLYPTEEDFPEGTFCFDSSNVACMTIGFDPEGFGKNCPSESTSPVIVETPPPAPPIEPFDSCKD